MSSTTAYWKICGIDPNVYSGFAFGIGIERIAMLKYGINNIGLMFENRSALLEAVRGLTGEEYRV